MAILATLGKWIGAHLFSELVADVQLAVKSGMDAKALKHFAWMKGDEMLLQLQGQIKEKSAAEIDALFTQKRAELRQWVGE